MNNLVETVARVFVVIVIAAMVVVSFHATFLPSMFRIATGTLALVQLTLHGAIGYWLFQKSHESGRRYPGVWCLLGLVFGLMAVALYYLVDIHKKVSRIKA